MTSITNTVAVIIIGLTSTGCITVPPTDKITSIDSQLPKEPTAIQPHTPYVYVEQIDQPQTLSSKINYLNTCMINYSWGRGWTGKTTFSD
jgi:hypothetical protein